eukprot:COSAG06_NODE_20666_length_786_cov_0.889374_1_plen_54_part_01
MEGGGGGMGETLAGNVGGEVNPLYPRTRRLLSPATLPPSPRGGAHVPLDPPRAR